MLDDISQALKAHGRAIEIVKALRVLNDMHTAAGDKELAIEGKVGERVVTIGGFDLAGPIQQRIETAATGLLAEEPVVIVAAIEADIIENAALAGEVDLVAVRALRDADTRR